MPKVIDVDRLFETTVRLFAERGYEATTTLEISRLAGINEATLYRRFGSKPKLVEEALRHCLAHSPFANLSTSQNTSADLLAIVKAYEQTVGAYGGAVLTLMIEMPRHEELQAASAALMPNFFKAVHIIAFHQDKGSLKPGNPAQILSILLSPVMMHFMVGRTGAAFGVGAVSAKQIVDGFLAGFAADR